MSYKAWYNENADYNTNARSYMDYLARHNKFMKVLVEDYEVFKELLTEEFKQFQLNTDETIDRFQERLDNIKQEMTDFFIVWLEDGTLEEIINVNIFNGKLDRSEFEEFLNTQVTKLDKEEFDTFKSEHTSTVDTIHDTLDTNAQERDVLNSLIYNSSVQNITRLQDIQYIAHRGASGVTPENTLPAYYKAKELGYWGTECDVRLTSDGVWVLMHDNTIDRTTNGTGEVSNLSLGQLKQLKVTEGNNIELYPDLTVPTLEEFLIVCKNIGLFPIIEIKQSNTPVSAYQNIIDLLVKYGLIQRSAMISFDIDEMQAIRDLNPDIHLFPILSASSENIDRVKDLGNATINLQRNNLNQSHIIEAHEKGLLVCVWNVNNVIEADSFINMGVDFIITDTLTRQWGDM